MGFDLIIRGGTVVDGTGLPRFTADVAVADGRIASIGKVTADAERVIDADGLIVAPGFIDVHTHYDAQVDWDPTASPSCWHGVTTVLAGNCGFTLAPARPEDCGWLAQMLSRVEGMSADALAQGMRWQGGTFGEFWDRVEGRVAVNIGGFVGHSAVRRFVMGNEASEREATPDEIAAMQQLVRAAMREGAMGFSTSQLDIHVAHDGREVPSNYASADEILALCAVLAEFGRGVIEFIPHSFATGYDEADRALMLGMVEVSGRPLELNTLFPHIGTPGCWKDSLEFCREAQRNGARIHPMFATNRMGAHLALESTFLLDELATFRDTLTLEPGARERALRDPAVRDKIRAEMADGSTRAMQLRFETLEVEEVERPEHQPYVGRTVAELAREQGVDGLDFFLDLSLAEGLRTGFCLAGSPSQAMLAATAEQIQDPICLAGSSDAGAHLQSFVGADYTTRLLTEWVPETISLEAAIQRLTLFPAMLHGLRDRGTVREGFFADLVVFDPTRLAAGATTRTRDFPADSTRYIVGAEGYRATVVNGEVVMEDGVHTGAEPGHVLRGA
jgi:N-acyl-D-aspartate/D-glutamate deacylase